MNKMAIVSDLHLRMYSDVMDEDGIPLKLKEILNSVEYVCKYCLDHNINKIAVLGDINDLKTTFSVKSFLLFSDIIRKYYNLQWFLVGGNHDLCSRINENGMFSSVELFSKFDNVKVFFKPEEIYISDEKILILPYYDENVIKEYMRSSDTRIVFGHLGLSDVKLSTGVSLVSHFHPEEFSKFNLVILGHYHKPQEIKVNDTNIVYVGSIIQIRRDEINEDKRFIVLDLDELTFESVQIVGYRKYYEYVIDGSKAEEEVLNDIDELRKSNFIVVVKIIKKFPVSSLNKFSDCKIIDLTEEDFSIRGILSNMSIEEQMKKYLEIMGVDESYRDTYLDIGLKAIQS